MANDNNKKKYIKYEDTTYELVDGEARTAIDALKANRLSLHFSDAPTIPDNADLNSYRTPGSYKVNTYASSKTIAQIPERTAGRLIVMSLTAATRLLQIYIPMSATPKFWVRTYADSWYDWYCLQPAGTVSSALGLSMALGDETGEMKEEQI